MAAKYDAIVIGTGQAGVPLAKALAEAGKKTALIEHEHIGGTCINEGCTPTKTMIASGRVAYLTRRNPDQLSMACTSKVLRPGVRQPSPLT